MSASPATIHEHMWLRFERYGRHIAPVLSSLFFPAIFVHFLLFIPTTPCCSRVVKSLVVFTEGCE